MITDLCIVFLSISLEPFQP